MCSLSKVKIMLTEQQLQLKEFFVEGKNQKNFYILLHISDPSTREEKTKGHFFVLCEINTADRTHINKLQKIFEQAGTIYYRNVASTNEDSLEEVLGIVNNQAEHIMGSEYTIHCAIGIITTEELIFSFYNQPRILLYYKNRQGSYQTMDLVQNNASPLNTPQDTKTQKIAFNQIIKGKLAREDFLLITSHELITHLSIDELKEIITLHSIEESAHLIETKLIKLRSFYSFGGLLIQHTTEQIQIPKIDSSEGSEESLQKFFATEKNTTQTLSSSLGSHLAKRFNSPRVNKPVEMRNTTLVSQGLSGQKNVFKSSTNSGYTPSISLPTSPNKYFKLGIKKIFTFVFTILFSLLKSFFSIGKGLLIIIINLKGKRKEIINTWQKQSHGFKENIKQLPLITKILLICSSILITIFVTSIIVIHQKDKKDQSENAYKILVDKITKAQLDIEGTIIYDEKNAAEKMADALTVFQNLPCETKKQKEMCVDFSKKFEAISLKLNKMTIIETEPLTIWQPEAGVILESLIKVKNKLISFSSNHNKVYLYDLTTREQSSQETNLTNNGFNFASSPQDSDYLLFVSNHTELIQFNPEQKIFKKIEVSFTQEQPTINSILAYNGRLYTADVNQNQIYRHDATLSGFGRGREWITKSSTPLSGAASLAIDGDLYIATENGSIFKFTKGVQENFSIQNVNPELKKIQKIWTYTDLKYLYILDPEQKRIIILDKQGKLIQQITAQQFEEPKDMIIDEENKIGYILDKNRVFKILLPI